MVILTQAVSGSGTSVSPSVMGKSEMMTSVKRVRAL